MTQLRILVSKMLARWMAGDAIGELVNALGDAYRAEQARWERVHEMLEATQDETHTALRDLAQAFAITAAKLGAGVRVDERFGTVSVSRCILCEQPWLCQPPHGDQRLAAEGFTA